MSRIRITLPEDLDAQLTREAERVARSKSELVGAAIAEYLGGREQEQFLGQLARAAAVPGDDAIDLAEEAFPLDNEALGLASRAGRAARYRSR
jgi:metal-responsive CopG/Arc/MetJ family transcriptional regulator